MMTNPKELKSLQQLWYKKLKASGFEDAEDNKHRLKSKDSRTRNFLDRDLILAFFLELDHYLAMHGDTIPKLHVKILTLYSDGIFITEIAKSVKRSRSRVKQIIKHYKDVLKGGHFPSN